MSKAPKYPKYGGSVDEKMIEHLARKVEAPKLTPQQWRIMLDDLSLDATPDYFGDDGERHPLEAKHVAAYALTLLDELDEAEEAIYDAYCETGGDAVFEPHPAINYEEIQVATGWREEWRNSPAVRRALERKVTLP